MPGIESVSPATVGAARLPHICFSDVPSTNEESPVMIEPTMADDLDVLERHLAPSSAETAESKRYVRMSSGSEAVMYRTTPRIRPGWQGAARPGKVQREIMENVLGSRALDVIKLYFAAVNPWFPIIDEVSFWSLWQKDASLVSPTLMCNIYAIALAYWDTSDALRDTARPDMPFAWNQAVQALRDDCMAPSLTTVHAALLEMLGRPVYHITGNIVTAGRTVSLAHSQGLHRDPTSWRTSNAEKSLRIRIWWAVLIHDHWSSLSHGTPPNITSGQYDVPLPEPDSFVDGKTSTLQQHAGSAFLQLCRLTVVLGEILPIVYALKADHQQVWKGVRRVDAALDAWEDNLPDIFDIANVRGIDDLARQPSASGLRFYYLVLKLMLKRLALRITLQDKDHSRVEARQYRFTELHDAALTVVTFITSLVSDDFRSFWLPYTTYLLVSATTTLLRCTVECANVDDKRRSADALQCLLQTLRTARKEYDWDLADLCIETCGQSIEKLAALYGNRAASIPDESHSSHNAMATGSATNALPPADVDLQVPFDDSFWLDVGSPWVNLWDDTTEPWQSVG